jgi:hypothetical protein
LFHLLLLSLHCLSQQVGSFFLLHFGKGLGHGYCGTTAVLAAKVDIYKVLLGVGGRWGVLLKRKKQGKNLNLTNERNFKNGNYFQSLINR